jgi:putrescine aminotransferase
MWGCDHEGVVPDLMTSAKALGGGVMPLGALIGTAAIWEAIYAQNPLAHTSTFGANPLACAAGLAGLQVLEDEGLVARSAAMGAHMLAALRAVQANHAEWVAEVRGRGLMVGVEFALDEVGELVVAQLMKRGVCVAYALNNPRVLRFEPPFLIDGAQIDFVAEALDGAIGETAEMLALVSG